MAAMKKNRNKKKAKGKQVDDFEGDVNASGDATPAEQPEENLAAKAPEEANLDDEFALPDKKGKGKNAKPAAQAEEDDDEERNADGRVLTKKEKEKLKKEREKQRKKEQVRNRYVRVISTYANL
jgi:translation initiation factor 5B